jgi:hypothetical protein
VSFQKRGLLSGGHFPVPSDASQSGKGGAATRKPFQLRQVHASNVVPVKLPSDE